MFNLNFLTFNFLNFLIFAPLDQFNTYLFISGIGMTNLNFVLFLIFVFIILINLTYFLQLKKTNWVIFTLIRNLVFNFIGSLLNSNILLKKHFFAFLYYFLFLIILGCNIIGLFPFSYTITSSFIITFSFAFIFFLGINIIAMFRLGFFNFFSLFMPAGTPIAIIPLLTIIEIISYIARLFSLSIRLFANMMAGHTLLKILIGFSFSILIYSLVLVFFALGP
jgi:ATP synthase subunit 6